MESEIDIDYRIKMFRKKVDKELGDTNIKKIIKRKYRDPTNENPVRIAEFLSFLDLTAFRSILKKFTHGLKE